MISAPSQVKLKAPASGRTYETIVPLLTMPRYQGISQWGTSAKAWEEVRHFRLWNFIAISAVANKVSEYFPNVSIVSGAKGAKSSAATRQYSRARLEHAFTTYGGILQAAMPQDIKPVPDNHPLVQLFRTVNTTDWWSMFVYEMIVFKRLTGINYLWAIPNGAGLPAEMWNIPPQWVDPVDGLRDRRTGQVTGWRVIPEGDSSREIIIPPEEVIAWRSVNPLSKRLPLSPLRATSEWNDSQEAIERSRVQTFRQGAFPTVLVETPDQGADNDWYLDDTFYRQAAEKFTQRYGGVDKAGMPLIAPPGYRYKPWSLAPREMDFNESAAQVRDMILAEHGVPKVIAGITEEVNYASAMAARDVFCRETIQPILQDLAGLLSETLASQFDPRLRVWFDDCVPRNDESFRADVQMRFATGSITPRMIAAEYGDELPDDEGFDKAYLPLTLVAIGSELPEPATPVSPNGGNDGQEQPPPPEGDGTEGDGTGNDSGGSAGQSVNGHGLWLPAGARGAGDHNGNGHARFAIGTAQAAKQTRRLKNVHAEFLRRQAAWERRARTSLRKFWTETAASVKGRLESSGAHPDVAALLPDSDFKRRFNAVMEPLWASMAEDGAKLEFRSIGAKAVAAGVLADEMRSILFADELPDIFVDIQPQAKRAIRAFLKDRAVGIWRYVLDTAKSAMAKVIDAGLKDGSSIPQIRSAIMDAIDVSRERATLIARTEATASLNAGAQAIREDENIEQKVWIATMDDRTREDHAAADNQVQNNDDPFDVGGSQMMYPGDGSLGAGPEEICNCRCTSTGYVEL